MITQLSGALFGTGIENTTKTLFAHGKYLVHADAVDLKGNQGAKKTGGLLPGGKVSSVIADARRANEGESLQSPTVLAGLKSVEQIWVFLNKFLRKGVLDSCNAIDGGCALHIKDGTEYKSIAFAKKKNAYLVSIDDEDIVERPYFCEEIF